MDIQTIETLKGDGRYAHAGALAAFLGLDSNYGCHFGLRSTRNAAAAEYLAGYRDAWRHLYVNEASEAVATPLKLDWQLKFWEKEWDR